jgi:protein-S-isoprenylcysteine O-methyltransferase Ste14
VPNARWLARLRVPLGWILGLAALYLARPTPKLLAAGVSVALLGEGVRLWASGHLEKNRRLTTTGPYAWTRNPLYLGSLFVGLGFCIAAGRISLVVVLVALFLLVYVPVMKREAQGMRETYPAEYAAYASRVPLFLPRLPERFGASSRGFDWARVVRNREHVTLLGLLLVVGMLGLKLMAGW